MINIDMLKLTFSFLSAHQPSDTMRTVKEGFNLIFDNN